MRAKVIATVAALAVAALAVAGCGGAKPATAGRPEYLYVPRSRTGELLQWRDKDGKLSGTFKDIWMDGHAPAEGIITISSGLSGTLNGTAITLSIGLPHLSTHASTAGSSR